MMSRLLSFLGLSVLVIALGGCHNATTPAVPVAKSLSPPEEAAAANRLFTDQTKFDPWVLRTTDPNHTVPAYISNGKTGFLVDASGNAQRSYTSGKYAGTQLAEDTSMATSAPPPSPAGYSQELDMRTGELTTTIANAPKIFAIPTPDKVDWQAIWKTSDIAIDGDPEAAQVTHACLFYLLSSTTPGSDNAIPPMGLSSKVYGGHIFWDADIWMLPALVPQYPDYARSIIDYRFKTLEQAKKNARGRGLRGAEFAWESAGTGEETAPPGFADERHITADVAFAAWQYYLWTGDKAYLKREGWPLISASADYWAARAERGADGKYHLQRLMSPDETAGLVNDDAYTNAVVRATLLIAGDAAKAVSQPANSLWNTIASVLLQPFDPKLGIPAENPSMTDKLAAKQADTLLLIHPLGIPLDNAVMGRMLDFYIPHTIKNGPAMTASINAIVAAKLGRGQQSLDEFRDAYRPFMRGPFDAFSEKRTTNGVYFVTGMGGLIQSVLYGFAGLSVHTANERGNWGEKLAGDAEAALYANPHLPPGWDGLTIKGVQFRGKIVDLKISSGNKVSTLEAKP